MLRQYSVESLTSLSVVSVAALLLSYALYVIDLADAAGAQFHPLELTFPFVMYGVFRYYNKYKFTVKSSHNFTVEEGKGTSIKVRAYERGGATTPMEKRPGLDFKVSVIQGGKR